MGQLHLLIPVEIASVVRGDGVELSRMRLHECAQALLVVRADSNLLNTKYFKGTP